MARLKLKAERLNEGAIRVSWTDVYYLPQHVQILFGLVAFVGFILGLVRSITTEAMLPFGLALLIALFTVFLTLRRYSKINMVTFSADTTKTLHNGIFPTAEITRFDMTTKQDEATGNPTIIRLWIDDSASYTIAENKWDQGVNHQIRDTLDKSLRSVRDAEKTEQMEEEFGETGDFGMPDY